MFNTYSYKTVPLAGIQRNQTNKKIKLKLKKIQLNKMKFLQLLQMFYFYFIQGCACIHLLGVFEVNV